MAYMQVNTLRTWHEVRGAGHPVVLLHGAFAHAFPLAALLDGMRQAPIFGHRPGAIWSDMEKLLAWLVVGLVVSLRTFRWERAA